MGELVLKEITKRYGDNVVVNDFNLSIEKGELISLLGPSGCGKSTTLRMIAGFITPEEGRISISDTEITNLPPSKRDTSLVFQNYALFPHMTVFDNVAYGLKMRKVQKNIIKEKVEDALKMVRLDQHGDRYPSQLSGGQQQRVALARALIVNPKILLLDEPLSNLDAKLRIEMRNEILRLQKELNLTCVFVTHDQEEALVLSDRIVVMNQGQIQQIGAPNEIFDKPKSHFTADFVGVRNFYKGELTNNNFVTEKGLKMKVNETEAAFSQVGIRPNMLVVNPVDKSKFDNECQATIDTIIYKGTIIELTSTTSSGEEMVIEASSENTEVNDLNIGDTVNVCWNAKNIIPLYS